MKKAWNRAPKASVNGNEMICHHNNPNKGLCRYCAESQWGRNVFENILDIILVQRHPLVTTESLSFRLSCSMQALGMRMNTDVWENPWRGLICEPKPRKRELRWARQTVSNGRNSSSPKFEKVASLSSFSQESTSASDQWSSWASLHLYFATSTRDQV